MHRAAAKLTAGRLHAEGATALPTAALAANVAALPATAKVAALLLLLLRERHADGPTAEAAAAAAQSMVAAHDAHGLGQRPVRRREAARIEAAQATANAQLRAAHARRQLGPYFTTISRVGLPQVLRESLLELS